MASPDECFVKIIPAARCGVDLEKGESLQAVQIVKVARSYNLEAKMRWQHLLICLHPTSSLAGCVALGKLLKLAKLMPLHPENTDNKSTKVPAL